MSSAEILKLFMVVAFSILVITDLSAVADSDVDHQNNSAENTNTASVARFKQLDANQDGKISLKEAIKDQDLIEKFESADTNTDSMISAKEYLAFRHG